MTRKQRVWVGVLSVAVPIALGATALVTREPQPRFDLSIVYSGDLMGELEPCGCAEESNVGGLKRQATVLEKFRNSPLPPIVISTGGAITSNSWQDKLKAEHILRAFKEMNYDSIGVKWRDLAYGEDFLASQALPLVSSNLTVTGAQTARYLQRADHVVAHYSWLDLDDPRAQHAHTHSAQRMSHADSVNRALAEDQARGVTTIVSTSLTESELERELDLASIDIVITASADENYAQPRKVGSTVVIAHGTRGLRLGKIDVRLDARGRVIGFADEVVTLSRFTRDAKSMTKWYLAYNDAVKTAFQRHAAQRKQLRQESDFAGADQCASCHAAAFATWRQSKHASAFRTLERVDKHFDPECVACHTVGFDKPGGFVDMSATRSLADVQCENCHGGAREHVSSGGLKPLSMSNGPAAQQCSSCHYGSHSPSFDFSEYWPRIVHGK